MHPAPASPKTTNDSQVMHVDHGRDFGRVHQFACVQVLFQMRDDDIYRTVHIFEYINHPELITNLARTRSSCLHANSSSWLTSTGNLSITGRDIVFTDDSIISAPY
jgi:hypothetical protein